MSRYDGTPEEKKALGTYIKLWRATHALETRANRHLGEYGLTVSQFAVLEALYHLGPLSQGELSQKILRSSGNLTLVVSNLVRDGLVQRERDASDRRVLVVSLTEAGRTLIGRILPRHVQGIRELFEVLDEPEREQLAALARKLGLALRETQS